MGMHNGHIEVVELLLPYLSRKDIKSKYNEAINYACKYMNTEIFELLLPYLSKEDIKSVINNLFRWAYPFLEHHPSNNKFKLTPSLPP